MHSVVASRYAKALTDSVLAPGSNVDAEAVRAQLAQVQLLMDGSPELTHVMLSPAVASSKKRAVVKQLAPQMALSQKVQNFLYVLIDHRRIHQLAEIREAFEMAVDEALGLVKAHITSAQPVDEGQRGALESQLQRLTGKRVRADYATDSSLIGGLVARIGSTVFDGSVKGQLDVLRKKLATEA